MKKQIAFVVLSWSFAITLNAQSQYENVPGLNLKDPKPRVLLVGMYHMANNNLDLVKTDWDSPFSTKRQAEIHEVVTRLKNFKPTKIAVEAPWGNVSLNERYTRYAAGQDTLRANEIDQIGLRMAQQLGHKQLYPIDYKKDMDFDRIMQFALANGQQRYVERMQQIMGFISALDEKRKTLTVREHLREINADAALAMGNAPYLLLAEVGKDTSYVGAEVVAGWYERNLKIAMNIIRLAESPAERILVLIGAGHVPLLRQFLQESPSVEVVGANEYLK